MDEAVTMNAQTTSLLPASSNWYCSRVADSTSQGLVLFGAKNQVQFLELGSESDTSPRFTGNFKAHDDRVVSVALCHVEGYTHLCATAGEDGAVNLWDLRTNTLKHTMRLEGRPTCLHWNPLEADWVTCGDDLGWIVFYSHNNFRRIRPEATTISCLTHSPLHLNHVAVGYQNGKLLLLDVNSRTGEILLNLRGHDDAIQCLLWGPEGAREQLGLSGGGETGRSPGLLASGSKDRTIRIWNLDNGQVLTTLKLPTLQKPQPSLNNWTTLCWSPQRPGELISNSPGGDILLWDLHKSRRGGATQGGTRRFEVLMTPGVQGHKRVVFNIISMLPNHDKLVTFSMDRQILTWDLTSGVLQNKMSTLGGFVHSLALSPLNPNRLAVGVGDNTIRVCNLSGPSTVQDSTLLWQGLKSKVTALSWHPTKEGVLAYGTDDGRVGVYEVTSQRAPVVSNTFHKRTVYVVSWGPLITKTDAGIAAGTFVVYSCGDGTVVQHDAKLGARAGTDVNQLIAKRNNLQRCPSRSEISFKPDWSVVALGNEDGSIDVYSVPELRALCTVHVNKKIINVIRWHPQFTAQSQDASPRQYWIAIGSNESHVSVVDLQNVLGSQDGDLPQERNVILETMCRLDGHSHRVTGLSWSTHQEGWLVSASYDHTAQVWDVNNARSVANYRGHLGRLFCAQWSMLDLDVIYTGADDFCLHAWSRVGQVHAVPPKGKEWGKKKKKGKAAGPKPTEMNSSWTESEQTQKVASVGMVTTETVSPSGTASVAVAVESETETVTPGAASQDLAMLQEMLEAKKQQLVSQTTTETEVVAAPSVEECDVTKPALAAPTREDDVRSTASEQSEGHGFSSAPRVPNSQQKKGKKRKEKSLLPVFNTMATRGKAVVQQDTVRLASLLYAGADAQSDAQIKDANRDANAGGDAQRDAAEVFNAEKDAQFTDADTHLGLFVGRAETLNLLEREYEHHVSHSNAEQQVYIRQLTGDLGALIRDAAARGQLMDWHIAMSPTVHPQLWRDMCVAYARQLDASGSCHRSAFYYLCVHRVREAIDVLNRHQQYRDAVSLALSRLPREDPIFTDLYNAWAQLAIEERNFEQAAQCYLALRRAEDAAGVIARRGDEASQCVALHICHVTGETRAFRLHATRFVHECQLSGNWAGAAEVLLQHDSLKALALYTVTHETLCREMERLKVLPERLVQEPRYSQPASRKRPMFLLDPGVVVGAESPWQPVTCEGEALVVHIVGEWLLRYDSLSNKQILEYKQELLQIVEMKQTSLAMNQVMQYMSLCVSLGVLSALLGDTEDTAHWWSVALAQCAESRHACALLIPLCRLLLPQGPEKLIDLQQQVTSLTTLLEENTIATSLLANGHDSMTPRNLVNAMTSSECLNALYNYAVVLHRSAQEPTSVNDEEVKEASEAKDSALKALSRNSPSSHGGLGLNLSLEGNPHPLDRNNSADVGVGRPLGSNANISTPLQPSTGLSPQMEGTAEDDVFGRQSHNAACPTSLHLSNSSFGDSSTQEIGCSLGQNENSTPTRVSSEATATCRSPSRGGDAECESTRLSSDVDGTTISPGNSSHEDAAAALLHLSMSPGAGQ